MKLTTQRDLIRAVATRCREQYEPLRAGEPQSAVVCTDGWAGRRETPVTVWRETPNRYECEYADGRRKLVPKYAVRFTPNTTDQRPMKPQKED